MRQMQTLRLGVEAVNILYQRAPGSETSLIKYVTVSRVITILRKEMRHQYIK